MRRFGGTTPMNTTEILLTSLTSFSFGCALFGGKKVQYMSFAVAVAVIAYRVTNP